MVITRKQARDPPKIVWALPQVRSVLARQQRLAGTAYLRVGGGQNRLEHSDTRIAAVEMHSEIPFAAASLTARTTAAATMWGMSSGSVLRQGQSGECDSKVSPGADGHNSPAVARTSATKASPRAVPQTVPRLPTARVARGEIQHSACESATKHTLHSSLALNLSPETMQATTDRAREAGKEGMKEHVKSPKLLWSSEAHGGGADKGNVDAEDSPSSRSPECLSSSEDEERPSADTRTVQLGGRDKSSSSGGSRGVGLGGHRLDAPGP